MLIPIIENTLDTGNNETIKTGLYRDNENGEWIAITATQRRTYKTWKGALKGAKRIGAVKSHLKSERGEQ